MSAGLATAAALLTACQSGTTRPAPDDAPPPATTRLPAPPAPPASKSTAASPASAKPASANPAPAKPAAAATAPAPPTINAPGARPAPAPGGATLSAALLSVNVARVLTYDPAEGKGTTQRVIVRDEPPSCHCAGRSWWVRTYKGSTTGPAQLETHLTIDVNGYIAVLEQIDRAEGVEVVFTPPLVAIPDGLRAEADGKSGFTQDLRMSVHPLGDRSKVRSEGPAHVEIRYAGDADVATGAGVFKARKVVTTFTASLGPAKVTSASDEWYVDNIGLVAEREREVTRALGVQVRDNATSWILASFKMTP